VTVVEWGEGLVEVLAEDRLEVVIERPHGGLEATGEVLDAEVGVRHVTVTGVGPRWADVELPGATGR
jgi:tRNA threonylcarbamoyladenosine biosynthesis protein TsaE